METGKVDSVKSVWEAPLESLMWAQHNLGNLVCQARSLAGVQTGVQDPSAEQRKDKGVLDCTGYAEADCDIVNCMQL